MYVKKNLKNKTIFRNMDHSYCSNKCLQSDITITSNEHQCNNIDVKTTNFSTIKYIKNILNYFCVINKN